LRFKNSDRILNGQICKIFINKIEIELCQKFLYNFDKIIYKYYIILENNIFFKNNWEMRFSSLKNIVRRAAFDIGSGSIKYQVADVDIESGQIVKSLFERSE